MNPKLFVIVLLAIACQGPKIKQAPAEELLPTINRFNAAFAAADTTILSALLTNDYMHTNSTSGPWGKTGWLNYVQGQRKKLEQGTLKVEEYSMSDFQSQVYGNAAIVSAVITNAGREDTTSFSKSFKVTHLWIYEDGTWKRAGFHDGKIN